MEWVAGLGEDPPLRARGHVHLLDLELAVLLDFADQHRLAQLGNDELRDDVDVLCETTVPFVNLDNDWDKTVGIACTHVGCYI